jgi:uncharacterized Rmd1/YagE family protein
MIYCLADSIDLVALKAMKGINFEKPLAKDVVYYHDQYDAFIFNNGTMVIWNSEKEQAEQLINRLSASYLNPFQQSVDDTLTYYIDPHQEATITPSDKNNNDVLILNTDEAVLKLSFSYGLSRSIKLKALEQRVETIIEKYAPLANLIYRKGKINMSRKGVLKIIGELMIAKSDINLVNNFSYLPAFFWRNPLYEKQFILLEKYMDIEVRADALNSRLNTLNEVFALLNSYLEYKRSHFLEVAITIFVGIEVIFSFLNLHF